MRLPACRLCLMSTVLDFGMYTPYLQIGYYTEVRLPETSSWPDVKTNDPNLPAYAWARQRGITFGWSDGKFHADAGISNATVAAFIYHAAGSPAVKGDSPTAMLLPVRRSTVRFCGISRTRWC